MFNKFFSIVDMCLSCEDTARRSCPIVRRWRFLRHFASCISSEPHISDLHFKFALRPHMCRGLVDIHSVAAEITRGKKKR